MKYSLLKGFDMNYKEYTNDERKLSNTGHVMQWL